MLNELKFVQGAVAKKDFMPAMTHFAIENGTVRAYNGVLALSSPIAFNIDCLPKASQMVQAIRNCNDVVTMTMTPAGKLRIASGKFKAFVECVDEPSLHALPEGEVITANCEALLKGLRVVEPFIGTDASRPWCTGVLIDTNSMFATNNAALIEYWTGLGFPRKINLPREAVKELLRIGEVPSSVQVAETSITFHYENGRWLRSQLYSTEWPDLGKVLNRPSNAKPIDKRIFEAVDLLKPFCDKLGRIFIAGERFSTHADVDSEGAEFTAEGFSGGGIYRHEILSLLDGVATTCDFDAYPNPCAFFGENLRGAIIGMKI